VYGSVHKRNRIILIRGGGAAANKQQVPPLRLPSPSGRANSGRNDKAFVVGNDKAFVVGNDKTFVVGNDRR
jgi:hypothetical protein